MPQRLCALLLDQQDYRQNDGQSEVLAFISGIATNLIRNDCCDDDLTEGLGAIMYRAARALLAVPSVRTFQSTYDAVPAVRHWRELASNDALRSIRVSVA